MRHLLLPVLLCFSTLTLAAEPACSTPAKADSRTLTAFASEAELAGFFKCMADAARKRQEAERLRYQSQADNGMMAKSAVPMPAASAAAESRAGVAAESVTNTQTAGVDEGGIVKVHGDHLVILRRGRLFTVDISGRDPRPVAFVDAFAPKADPRGAWYDEMLISGDTIVVIGYSYARGGTEVGLFDIDAKGRLAYRATYHLRSNDYYSARNYASRLIGSKLIFYSPLYVNFYGDPWGAFPAVRRWQADAKPADFKRIAAATRIYPAPDALESQRGLALHSVTICDLAKAEMSCEATAVLGPHGRVFYVSSDAVYVWVSEVSYGPRREAAYQSSVFRIPLDGSAPSALKTAGAPIDQFSFLESEDRHLNVLVRSQGRGDGMWSSERSQGDMALLRVPLGSFGNGSDSASEKAYRRLPHPGGYTVQNRFVGDFLLYGAGIGWRPQSGVAQNLYALRWAEGEGAQAIPLAHSVDRIEAMGSHAVVVGTRANDLYFSSVELGKQAGIASFYTRKDAAQGETRSHGFFYKPLSSEEGYVGLPITGAGRPGYRQLTEESAAVLFLKNSALRLAEIGTLSAQPGAGSNDGCQASCVDWYGNSRPLFLKSRVFALMGYELVEGRITGQTIKELRRINFAPQRPAEIAR